MFLFLPTSTAPVLKVVVKTRTEFQTEKKRLKVPKVEEFTISFTDGVSERLKVQLRVLNICCSLACVQCGTDRDNCTLNE